MNKFTLKEEEALENLRSRIVDMTELDEFHRHDMTLIRFLRARDLNVAKAEEMFRNNIKWRKDNNIDDIHLTPHSEDMAKRFPCKLSGYDEEGCYVYIANVGRYDYRAMVEEGKKEEFIHFMTKMSDLSISLMKYKSAQTKTFINAAVGIMDYDGFNGMRLLSSRETMQLMQRLMMTMQDNYPEMMKVCIVINAPKIFAVLYTILKPLLSKATMEKVQVYGSNSATWKEVLLKYVPPDQLPSHYGGANTTCMDYKWEDGYDVTPKIPTYSLDDMITETIAAGQKFEVDIEIVQKSTQLGWNFKTDDYDIGFSVHFKKNGEEEPEEIVPMTKCDAHVHVQKGQIVCTKTGKYTLSFDNGHSKFRSKTLYYVVKEEEATIQVDL